MTLNPKFLANMAQRMLNTSLLQVYQNYNYCDYTLRVHFYTGNFSIDFWI